MDNKRRNEDKLLVVGVQEFEGDEKHSHVQVDLWVVRLYQVQMQGSKFYSLQNVVRLVFDEGLNLVKS